MSDTVEVFDFSSYGAIAIDYIYEDGTEIENIDKSEFEDGNIIFIKSALNDDPETESSDASLISAYGTFYMVEGEGDDSRITPVALGTHKHDNFSVIGSIPKPDDSATDTIMNLTVKDGVYTWRVPVYEIPVLPTADGTYTLKHKCNSEGTSYNYWDTDYPTSFKASGECQTDGSLSIVIDDKIDAIENYNTIVFDNSQYLRSYEIVSFVDNTITIASDDIESGESITILGFRKD